MLFYFQPKKKNITGGKKTQQAFPGLKPTKYIIEHKTWVYMSVFWDVLVTCPGYQEVKTLQSSAPLCHLI